MDTRRFDALTKTLASQRSRRSVVRGIGGLAGGLLAAAALGRTASADRESAPGQCVRQCKVAAKQCRKDCAREKEENREKKTCLRVCKQTAADCRAACRPADE